MTRPRLRLSSLLELVACAAVGLTLSRIYHARIIDYFGSPNLAVHLRNHVLVTSAGFAMVETGFLAIERVRGTGPKTWGLGRWSLTAAGLLLSWSFLEFLVLHAVEPDPTGGRKMQDPVGYAVYCAGDLMIASAPALCAGVAAAALAGWPSRSRPADFREWTGRVVASLIVASWIVIWVSAVVGSVYGR